MPVTYQVLGQQAPTIGFDTLIYRVPIGTQTIISSISVCNRGSSIGLFSVRIVVGGGASAPEQYIYFAVPIVKNDTFIATIGVTLNAMDEVWVYGDGAGGNDLSFQLFGSEIT